MIPDIVEQIDINNKEIHLTDDQKQTLLQIFSDLPIRQRKCYLIYIAEGLSMSRTAKKINITKTSKNLSLPISLTLPIVPLIVKVVQIMRRDFMTLKRVMVEVYGAEGSLTGMYSDKFGVYLKPSGDFKYKMMVPADLMVFQKDKDDQILVDEEISIVYEK